MNPTESPEFERLEQSTALMLRHLESYRCCCDVFKQACARCDYALASAAIRDAHACVQEAQRLIDHHQAALDAWRSALSNSEESAQSRRGEDRSAVPLFPPNRAKLYVVPPVHATPSLEHVAVQGQRLLAQLSTANPAELRMVARNLRKLSHHAKEWARRTDLGVQDGCHIPEDSPAGAADVTGNDARDDDAASPIALRPV